MLCWLKEFQTTIVGVLGFVGVMVTLGWNARLARKARQASTDHLRLTTRVALREELRSLREEMEGWRRSLPGTAVTDDGTPIGVYEPAVYATLLKDIGVLNEEQTRIVIRTHGALRTMRTALLHMFPPSDDTGTVKIPGEKLGFFDR